MNAWLSVFSMPSGTASGSFVVTSCAPRVLMINRVHILIYPQAKLSHITKAIKNFSARQANALLGRTGQPFWQDESYDHWVRGPQDWRWSSAFDALERQARRPVPPLK